MIQKDKELLLLKDLCARLLYGVKVNVDYINFNRDGKLISINYKYELGLSPNNGYPFDASIEKCKPYLFPMSSMTEEQRREQEAYFTCIKHDMSFSICRYMEWCYKNHLDVNGLIPKGLAIDATGKNIY